MRGRPRNIKLPEDLWGYWQEYKDWVQEHPIKVQDFVGKDGQEVWRLKTRPLTIQRFEAWMAEHYSITVKHYLDNTNNAYTEFCPIITRIMSEKWAENIEGGMAGIYHANLTARVNGLSEKTDNKTELSGEVVVSLNLNA